MGSEGGQVCEYDTFPLLLLPWLPQVVAESIAHICASFVYTQNRPPGAPNGVLVPVQPVCKPISNAESC